MKKIFFIVLAILSQQFFAQELNCRVQVLTPAIQGDKHIYETLQKSIIEFMNNTRWTKDNFKSDEKIEFSLTITVSDRSTDDFKASIQVQSQRPVYKAAYNSVLMNYSDPDYQFHYVESQSLDYSDNAYTSNLTSVLAFYAYMVIGLDYDSFSLNGGSPYYQKANAIVNNAQTDQSVRGWQSSESQKNRYWMVNNMLDPVYAPIREYMYKYHRMGLDVMSSNRDQGLTVITDNLSLLQKAYRDRPTSFTLQLFFTAKADELVNIFQGAQPGDKSKALTILNEIDPANANKYAKINN